MRFAFPAVVASLLVASACAKGKAAAADGGPDAAGLADAGANPDADVCPGDPCALLEQCGCGGTQVCDLDPANLTAGGTLCRDVSVPGNEASNCAGASECGAGYSCFGGQCKKYCDGDEDCGDGQCFYTVVDGDSMPVPGAELCTKACAPEKPSDNGCPASPQFGCRIFLDDPDDTPGSGDEYFLRDCTRAPATGGGNDAACATSGSTQCAPGFDCFSVTQGGVTADKCKQLCVFEINGNVGPRVCATGTCSQLVEPVALIDGVEYGACL